MAKSYRIFNKDGKMTGKCGEGAFAVVKTQVESGDGYGWIEDETGKLIAGKKSAGTIDLTPTWKQHLPTLLLLLQSGNAEAYKAARSELERMAEAADAYNSIPRRLGS